VTSFSFLSRFRIFLLNGIVGGRTDRLYEVEQVKRPYICLNSEISAVASDHATTHMLGLCELAEVMMTKWVIRRL
jgi:hypothetical protein